MPQEGEAQEKNIYEETNMNTECEGGWDDHTFPYSHLGQ